MKIKIKSKDVVLPNCWKQCKVSTDDWEELKSGKEINVSFVPESINNMVEIVKSPSKKEGAK
jgi:hypothetical protein